MPVEEETAAEVTVNLTVAKVVEVNEEEFAAEHWEAEVVSSAGSVV